MFRFVCLVLCALAPTIALGQQPAPNRLYRKECHDGVCTLQYVGSEYENRVVDLVNQERTSRGLRPLRVTQKLMTAARGWSRTQANSRRMYHSTMGYPENVAMGQRNPESVMSAWMNSPGHRANILNGSYSAIGVGAVQNGSSIFWTQVFE